MSPLNQAPCKEGAGLGLKIALACLPTVRKEQVAAVAVVAAGAYDKARCRQRQASKQANNGHTVGTRAATGVCSGRRRVSGGVVGGEW